MIGHDCTIIIFGASGDLARRKLIPALYKLVASNVLEKFLIVGAAQTETTMEDLIYKATDYIKNYDESIIQQLLDNSCYQAVDIVDGNGFAELSELVQSEEEQRGLSGNRLLYSAVPSSLYVPIVDHAVKNKLLVCRKNNNDATQPWHRVVFEKPFGTDTQSAEVMYQEVTKCLDDDQIYIIDHYLAKEIIGNIAMVRFTNRVFEPLWNKENIESVTIKLYEELDVAGRIGFFEQFGALKDVVQNHMLQLLALVAMEEPSCLTDEAIQKTKADVLDVVQFKEGYTGQYQGYLEHEGVRADSTTETYAHLTMSVNNDRWQGVPFYLETGKCMSRKETSIEVLFKPVPCLLTSHCPTDQNKLIIRVAPRGGFTLILNAKKLNVPGQVMPVEMEFCHECQFGLYTPLAYEVIISEVMDGLRGISVSYQELIRSWELMADIDKASLPQYTYECGTDGRDPKKEA